MNNARQWLEHTVNLYPQFKIVDFSRTSIKDFLARLMQQNNLNGIVDGDIEYWDFVSNYFSAVGIFLPLNDKRLIAAGFEAKRVKQAQVEQPKPAEPVEQPKPAEPAKPVDPNNINGLVINPTPENINLQQFIRQNGGGGRVILSPMTFDELKAEIRGFKANEPSKFADGPVTYFKCDNGANPDPTINLLRYFFIFDLPNQGKIKFTWKRVKKGQVGVLRVNLDVVVAVRLMLTITEKPGKTWKNSVYTATRPFINALQFEVVFADNEIMARKNDNGVIVNVPAEAKAVILDNGVRNRQAIVDALYKKLLNELVGKVALDRRIGTRPKAGGLDIVNGKKQVGKVTIVPGRAADFRNGQFNGWIGPAHMITDEDAKKLAEYYDNWIYAGYDKNIEAALQKAMSIDDLGVKPEYGPIERPNQNAPVQPVDPKAERMRKIKVAAIRNRIKKRLDANPNMKIKGCKFTVGERGKTVIQAQPNAQYTENDIELLANNYDILVCHHPKKLYRDWWKSALDINNVDKKELIDPQMFDKERQQLDAEADAVQQEVDKALTVNAITADVITANMQHADGMPEGNVFHVKVPGVMKKQLSDAAAEAMLKRIGIWDGIVPAYQVMKKKYPNAKLYSTFNNKLTK